MWNYTVGAGISSCPAVSNGIVYVGSWDHGVYAFSGITASPSPSPSPSEEATASPAPTLSPLPTQSAENTAFPMEYVYAIVAAVVIVLVVVALMVARRKK